MPQPAVQRKTVAAAHSNRLEGRRRPVKDFCICRGFIVPCSSWAGRYYSAWARKDLSRSLSTLMDSQ